MGTELPVGIVLIPQATKMPLLVENVAQAECGIRITPELLREGTCGVMITQGSLREWSRSICATTARPLLCSDFRALLLLMSCRCYLPDR